MSNFVTQPINSHYGSNNIKTRTEKDKQMKTTLDLKLVGARLID